MLDIESFADSGQLFDNHYKLIRPLNTEGGTADVWLALDTSTVKNKDYLDEAPFLDDATLARVGLLVAIKIYKPKNALDIEGEQRFREEFMIVFNCNHTNLVHPVHFNIFEDTPYLVLPYCQRGSSEMMIGNFVKDDDIWRFIKDVASGLAYLHHCNPPIIHQDIKPANVLVDDNGNYAITDFGISAKRLRQTRRDVNHSLQQSTDGYDEYEEKSGTFAYMAPERFVEGDMPSAESDIWAFGATLYELITGTVPFGEDGGSTQTENKPQLSFNGLKIADDIKRLVSDCLSKDVLERPTAVQLIEAADAKKYASKKKRKPHLTIFLVAACVIITAGLLFLNMWHGKAQDNETEPNQETVSIENEQQEQPVLTAAQLFDDAMAWVNANDADSLRRGLDMLAELADNEGYIPAIYELAITYGGLAGNDEMKLDRKSLLGIALGNKDASANTESIPRDNLYNDKAIHYYTLINDSPGDDYLEYKKKSAYRLGVYYYLLKQDNDKALYYLEIAQQRARQNGDSEIESYTEQLVSQIKNQ